MPKITRGFSIDDYIGIWVGSKPKPSEFVNDILKRYYQIEHEKGFASVEDVDAFILELRNKIKLIEEDILSLENFKQNFIKAKEKEKN